MPSKIAWESFTQAKKDMAAGTGCSKGCCAKGCGGGSCGKGCAAGNCGSGACSGSNWFNDIPRSGQIILVFTSLGLPMLFVVVVVTKTMDMWKLPLMFVSVTYTLVVLPSQIVGQTVNFQESRMYIQLAKSG